MEHELLGKLKDEEPCLYLVSRARDGLGAVGYPHSIYQDAEGTIQSYPRGELRKGCKLWVAQGNPFDLMPDFGSPSGNWLLTSPLQSFNEEEQSFTTKNSFYLLRCIGEIVPATASEA